MLKKSHLFFVLLTWILFLLLNGLLFFPAFLVDCQLHASKIIDSTTASWWTPFVNGNYTQFFRLCGDFLLLLTPVLFLKKGDWFNKIYFPFAAFAYLLLIYYNLYLEGYKGMYSVHPVFQNDWVIVQEILPTFLREISVKGSTYLLTLIGFLFISAVVFILFLYLQRLLIMVKKMPIFWGIGVGVLLFSAFNLPENEIPLADRPLQTIAGDEGNIVSDTIVDTSSLSRIHWIYPDIQTSATLDRENHFARYEKRWIYDFYKQKTLVKKPNIFLLFVESYGGVASFSDYCESIYQDMSSELTDRLDSAGWYMASNYSKSTVIGGRSWLAMTTAMTGARVEDQIQYNELIKNRPTYPHMVDYFNQQGYETIRVSTMRIRRSDMDTLNMITIPNRFWKFDQRYFFPDIPYNGYQYDLYGGIPDQYTLGYVTDEILNKIDRPFFYTSITMNSHGPWHHKMPPIVENWRQLNDLKKPFGTEIIGKDMRIGSYWTAIDYQMRMLTSYIEKKGRDDSVYIIIGDHNPGGLEYKLFNRFNKWATPIHIISKDSSFVESFHQHGFTPGMQVDTSQFEIMRHMGLYSLLTRQLLENYGEEEVVLPEYLPWGL